MLKILHNTRCRKSRETLAIIQESGSEVEIVEYLKDVPSADELRSILDMLALAPDQLLRKGESVFKENYKGKDLTDEEWIEAMVSNPVLIERPIVIKGDQAIIGRPPENVNELL